MTNKEYYYKNRFYLSRKNAEEYKERGWKRARKRYKENQLAFLMYQQLLRIIIKEDDGLTIRQSKQLDLFKGEEND